RAEHFRPHRVPRPGQATRRRRPEDDPVRSGARRDLFWRARAMTTAPVLSAQSLVVGYGGRPVLSDVSIEVRAGEVLCVIGHNGAGKSTLMRALFGLTRPVSGTIRVDGKSLAHHVPRVLASHVIALMPEGRGIFPGLTVPEVFDLALWSGSIAPAERAARIDLVLSLLPPIMAFYG